MKQQCNLWTVVLTWMGLPILALLMGLAGGWWAGILVLVVGALAQIGYVKVFPHVSRVLGYGSLEDVPAGTDTQSKSVSKVTLFTANVCPFCPIVRSRLIELQSGMGFAFEEVDITFKPGLIREKGFRSVPVIESGGRYWVGNATSSQLLTFLTATT